jgi:hypothetical protein
MAIIKKKLDNLRPGKEYLVTVRAKNADINVVSEYSDSVRFTVPQDSTIPNGITNFHLLANFEKVMFVFDYNSDADLDRYQYELYDNSSGTGTPISSGFSAANVFTISVANSTDSIVRAYWGRVRAIDTTGNAGPWTVLQQTDQDTPLITEQYISSLTASKITAGTIGAHTITLNGINSILKSSNYSAGSSGWQIDGNGNAEFSNAIVRGTIDIGTAPNKFQVLSDGNVEIGDTGSTRLFISNQGAINIGTSPGTGPFQVASDGAVQIGTSPNLFKISNTGIVQIGDTTGTRLFINNNGAINIGTSLGAGEFIVQSNGQVDIGGNDVTSFHVDNTGEVWVGATAANKATAPFVLNNTGAIHVGGQDAGSLHIDPSGNIISGAPSSNTRTTAIIVNSISSATPSAGYVRYTLASNHGWSVGQIVSIYGIDPTRSVTYAKINATITHVPAANQFAIASSATGAYTVNTLTARRAAPFSLDTVSLNSSLPGTVRASDVEITGTISGISIDRNLSNVVRISDSVGLGSSTLYFTTSTTSYDAGINFTLSAANGFVARINTGSPQIELSTTGATFGNLVPLRSVYAWNNPASATAVHVDSSGLFTKVSSSIRYKKDVYPLPLEECYKVLELEPVTFKYKNDIKDIVNIGFIAEQALEVDERFVYLIEDENDKSILIPETVNYDKLIAPLVAIVRDLSHRISKLEN